MFRVVGMRTGFRKKLAYLLFYDMCVQCVLVTVTSSIPLSPCSHFYQTPSSSQEIPLLFSHAFSCLSFCFWWHVELTWGCLQAHRESQLVGVHEGNDCARLRRKHSTALLPASSPSVLSAPLCRVSRSEEAIDVPFRAAHSTVIILIILTQYEFLR